MQVASTNVAREIVRRQRIFKDKGASYPPPNECRNGRLRGPVVQWLERAAHNGYVAGSNPAGPTILLRADALRSFSVGGCALRRINLPQSRCERGAKRMPSEALA